MFFRKGQPKKATSTQIRHDGDLVAEQKKSEQKFREDMAQAFIDESFKLLPQPRNHPTVVEPIRHDGDIIAEQEKDWKKFRKEMSEAYLADSAKLLPARTDYSGMAKPLYPEEFSQKKPKAADPRTKRHIARRAKKVFPNIFSSNSSDSSLSSNSESPSSSSSLSSRSLTPTSASEQ